MWSREPAAIVGAIEAVLALLVAFGLDLSAEQVGAIVAVATVIGSLVTRATVWSPDSVEDVRGDTPRAP